MSEFETKVTNVTTDLSDTLIAKNHDYGNSFGDLVKEYGNIAMLIPLKNKIHRLDTLIKTDGKVKNESIEDTLRNLAGYAILSLIEMNDQKALAEQKQLIDENTKKLAEQSKRLDTQFPLSK